MTFKPCPTSVARSGTCGVLAGTHPPVHNTQFGHGLIWTRVVVMRTTGGLKCLRPVSAGLWGCGVVAGGGLFVYSDGCLFGYGWGLHYVKRTYFRTWERGGPGRKPGEKPLPTFGNRVRGFSPGACRPARPRSFLARPWQDGTHDGLLPARGQWVWPTGSRVHDPVADRQPGRAVPPVPGLVAGQRRHQRGGCAGEGVEYPGHVTG